MNDATRLLEGIQQSPALGPEELLPMVYHELRCLAAARMARERPGQTLQATALVHEVWLRVSGQTGVLWRNKEHFYAIAAEVMRRILVDRARRRQTVKHGAKCERVDLDEVDLPMPVEDQAVLELHDALESLAATDPVKADVVKLRFFVGLENAEIAALLGISESTVRRHWSFARAWLFRTMHSRP